MSNLRIPALVRALSYKTTALLVVTALGVTALNADISYTGSVSPAPAAGSSNWEVNGNVAVGATLAFGLNATVGHLVISESSVSISGTFSVTGGKQHMAPSSILVTSNSSMTLGAMVLGVSNYTGVVTLSEGSSLTVTNGINVVSGVSMNVSGIFVRQGSAVSASSLSLNGGYLTLSGAVLTIDGAINLATSYNNITMAWADSDSKIDAGSLRTGENTMFGLSVDMSADPSTYEPIVSLDSITLNGVHMLTLNNLEDDPLSRQILLIEVAEAVADASKAKTWSISGDKTDVYADRLSTQWIGNSLYLVISDIPEPALSATFLTLLALAAAARRRK